MEKLGPYEIVEEIGRGAFGVLYRARDPRLEREVALKVIPARGADDERAKRFLREARAAARLHHPAIVTVFDVGQEGAQAYIAMELVEGVTLERELASGPLPPGEVRRVGIALAQALDSAHQAGVVHRDLKPSNVMLAGPGRQVKLMDFGIARLSGQETLTRQGDFLGTVAYVSPEQAAGETATALSDVFSFGVMLYEMATGRLPFSADREPLLLFSILNDDPPAPRTLRRDLDEALERVILRCLEKDPARRFPSAARIAQALEPPPPPVEAAPPPAAPPAAVAGPRAIPLVGRRRLVEQLREALRAAVSGSGRAVLLGGEAGIGKTRLAEETLAMARIHGARTLRGRCLLKAGSRPYQPFFEALGDLMRLTGSERDPVATGPGLAAAAARWTAVAPAFRASPGGPFEEVTSPEGMWSAMEGILHGLAEEVPVVLLLDDLHWADEASLALFHYLARNVGETRLLLLATYRKEEIAGSGTRGAHPLRQVLHALGREGGVAMIDLERLSLGDTRELVVGALGEAEPADELAAALHRESEGNPLFVVEALRLLETDGLVVREDHTWRLREPLSRLPIPGKVYDVLRLRVAQLADADREALEAAAVQGEVFRLDAAAACLGVDEMPFIRTVARLEAGRYLERAGRGAYRFGHGKLREVLYEDTLVELREAYHRLTGRFLVEKFGTDEAFLGRIAHHLLEAGELAASVPYWIGAGRAARRLHAYEDAARFYRSALRVLAAVRSGAPAAADGVAAAPERIALAPPPSDAEALQEAEIRLALGQTTLAMADLDEAEAMFDHVRALDPLGGADLVARACYGSAEAMLARGRYAEAEGWARAGLERAGLPVLRTRGLRLMSDAAVRQGRYGDAERALQEVLNDAWTAGEQQELAESYLGLGNIYGRRGDFETALGFHHQAYAIFEARNAKRGMAGALLRIGIALRNLGRLDEAVEQLREADSLNRRLGDKRGMAQAQSNIGNIHLVRAELDEALTCYQQAASLFRRIGDRGELGYPLTNMGSVCLVLGRYDEAKRHYEEALQLEQEVGDLWAVASTQGNLGVVYLHQGRLGEAEALLAESLERRVQLGDARGAVEARLNLGQLCLAAGEFDRALAVLEQSLVGSQAVRDPGLRLGAAAALCECKSLQGSPEAGLEFLEAEAACLEARPEPELLAQMELARSRALQGQGRVAEAQEEAQRAVEAAGRSRAWHLTAESFLRLAEAAQRAAGAAASREQDLARVLEVAEEAERNGARLFGFEAWGMLLQLGEEGVGEGGADAPVAGGARTWRDAVRAAGELALALLDSRGTPAAPGCLAGMPLAALVRCARRLCGADAAAMAPWERVAARLPAR